MIQIQRKNSQSKFIKTEYFHQKEERRSERTWERSGKEIANICLEVRSFQFNTQFSEGLLYNPINMKIEDQERLYQRDLREKNKRQRFELRYDVEAMNRKHGLAD